MNPPSHTLPEAPAEPLATTAPLARAWAHANCIRDAAGTRCDYYHGLWQYLRLMGLGPTLGGHAPLYLQSMADLAVRWLEQDAHAQRQVLISACADYSMLAHVLQAFGAVQPRPLVTVLDICPTPLQLNAWYARETGAAVVLRCEDLLEHAAADCYDLVITSSVLGYFSPAQRPRLFKAYAAMLRPGGQLVFSNRLRPGAAHGTQTTFDADQAARFADKVAALASTLPPAAGLSGPDAHRMALDYATQRRPYPVDSAATIRRLAEDAGLRWVRGDPVHSSAAPAGISGPTLADGSEYLFVVLER